MKMSRSDAVSESFTEMFVSEMMKNVEVPTMEEEIDIFTGTKFIANFWRSLL